MAKTGNEITITKGLAGVPGAAFFGDMERMFEDMTTGRWLQPFGMFEDLSTGRWLQPFSWQRPFTFGTPLPHVDVIDHDDEVLVRAEVPGYKKEDIAVSVLDGSLSIKGETKSEKKEERESFYRCEISHGAFSRTVGLPAAVDESKAKASMKDGVLEIALPKIEKSKRRAIAIS